jgi:hypothetical protein
VSESEFLSRAAGIRDWFTPLNPYSEKGPVFKIEDENYRLETRDGTKQLEPLYCYAISPKRYVLFNLDQKGRPVIRKALAHGLGHLLPPLEEDYVPRSIPEPVVSLRDMDIKPWQYSLWYRILEAALSGNPNLPKIDDLPGFDRPAATRYGASTPSVLAWCSGYNKQREHRHRVRPFNFMLRFYARLPIGGQPIGEAPPSRVKRLKAKPPERVRPIAPFSNDPAEAVGLCFDRTTAEPVAADQLSTYAHELAQYHLHPDSKFLHAGHFDCGLTQRRHIIVAHVQHIGKEADSLEEQLELGSDPDAVIEYGAGREGREFPLRRLSADISPANLSRLAVASGISRQWLADIRDGERIPKRSTVKKVGMGLRHLQLGVTDRIRERDTLLLRAKAECRRIGLRQFASKLGLDHSTLAQVLSGKRVPSQSLTQRLERLL